MAQKAGGIYYEVDARTGNLIRRTREVDSATGRMGKGFSRLEKQTDRNTRSMFNLSRVAKGLAGVFAVRQIQQFTLNTINSIDAQNKFAQSIGVTFEQLQKLQFAAEQNGATNQEFNNSLRRLARRTEEAAEGTGSAVQAFRDLNLDARELQNLSPDQIFLRVADSFKTLEGNGRRVRTAFGLFDTEGAKLINTLQLGSDGIAELGDEADRTGRIIGQQTADDAARFNDELNKLQGAARGLAVQIGSELVPRIADLLSSTTDWLGEGENARRIIDGLGFAVKATALVMAGRLAGSLAATTVAFARKQIAQQAVIARYAQMNSVSVMAARGMVAASVAARGATAAFALLGGPAGVILIAASALAYFLSQQEQVQTETEKSNVELKKLADTFSTMSQAQARETEFKLASQLGEAAREASQLKSQLADLKSQPIDASGLAGGAGEVARRSQEIAELTRNIAANKEEQAILEALLARIAARQRDAADAADEHQSALDAKAYEEITQAIDDQLFKMRQGEQAFEIMALQRRANVDAMSEEGKRIAEMVILRDEEAAALDAKTQAEKDAAAAVDKAKNSYDDYAESLRDGQIELQGTEAVRDAFIENIRQTGATAGRSAEEIQQLVQSYRDLWSAQDAAAAGSESADAVKQLEQEIRLQEIKNQLGNDQYEIQAAIAALGDNATPEDEDKIARLVTQLQEARFQSDLLGQSLNESFRDIGLSALDDFSTGMAQAIVQGDSLQDVLKQVGRSIITDLLSSIIRYWAGQAAAAIAGQLGIAGATAAAGAAAAASWGPAATLASIATLGGAAGIGTAAVAGALAAGTSMGIASNAGGAVAGMGGGRLRGGPTQGGNLYPFMENGQPELVTANGNDYLFTPNRGRVTSNDELQQQFGGGSGGNSYSFNLTVPAEMASSREQIANVLFDLEPELETMMERIAENKGQSRN